MSETAARPGILQQMYERGAWSDLTIKTPTKDFAVHKAVLCPAWTYMHASCTRGFIETQSNEINLPEDEAVVDAILRYYYEMPWRSFGAEKKHNFIKLRVAIDKYGVEGLAEKVESIFQREITALDPALLVSIGVMTFAEDNTYMNKMKNAVVQASLDNLYDILRDPHAWDKILESKEYLHETLLLAHP